MNDELHRHLDGDVPADELSPAEKAEALAWDRMVSAFRRAAPHGQAPPWLEQRVMAELEAEPAPGTVRRFLAWLVRPAPVRISPLAVGATACVFLALAVLPLLRAERPEGLGTEARSLEAEQTIYVQFVFDAPSATSVAVAGDFTDWEPAFVLADPDGDGVWTGRVPVRPGVYGYMFVIDEIEWQTDPRAERYRDDGFGNRNAVLVVGANG